MLEEWEPLGTDSGGGALAEPEGWQRCQVLNAALMAL